MTIKLNSAMLMSLGFGRADIAALQALVTRSGISDYVVTPIDNAMQFEEFPVTNLEAIDALRAVDELRNELTSARGEIQQLRNRIELIEDRIA